MRRRTVLKSGLGVLAVLGGCAENSVSGENNPNKTQSGFGVDDVTVIEYKPKDYDDRPKIAGTLEVAVVNEDSDVLTITALRITGDVPSPHDETEPGVFSIPSQEVIEKVEIEQGDRQRIRMRHEPLYYVDLSSEDGRTQEELDSSTCTGETRSATLHFETEDRGTIDRDIQLRFGGDPVEFDEMAPDYGCTDVTVVNDGT